MQWVHPGSGFADESTAGFAVAIDAGGKHFADVLNVITLLGGFTRGLRQAPPEFKLDSDAVQPAAR
jgi:hypothetical protein